MGRIGHGWARRLAMVAGLLALAVRGVEAQAVTATRVEYYHLDALGSVRAVTNEAGDVVSRTDYEPFGAARETGPNGQLLGVPPQNGRLFTGQPRDRETGLDYFGARYYRAEIGRFTTIDPAITIAENVVDPQRWNRYAYARNNPLRFTDPDGRDFWDVLTGIANAVASNAMMAPRVAGNRDHRIGQAIGDGLSLVGSAIEFASGGGIAGGGAAACATGVGCPAGAPVVVAGTAVMAHAAAMGTNAGVALMKSFSDSSGSGEARGIPDSPVGGHPTKPSDSWLKSKGIDPHQLKEHFGSRVDIFVDRAGNVWTKPKKGSTYEWQGALNDFKVQQ